MTGDLEQFPHTKNHGLATLPYTVGSQVVKIQMLLVLAG